MSDAIKAAMWVRLSAVIIYVALIYGLQQVAVFSAFVGAIACFIPESYQGWRLSRTGKEYEPSKWLRLAYQSIISKWLMTAVIFAVSFSSSILWDYKILFIGYLVVSVSGLLTPILVGKR